ncbi:hypothetical protein F4804DRAFT_109438 [Jackrogersella minutella]|nr:hypothetical protein F4804DRAFT_109438 [Jackrogersella minutella]
MSIVWVRDKNIQHSSTTAKLKINGPHTHLLTYLRRWPYTVLAVFKGILMHNCPVLGYYSISWVTSFFLLTGSIRLSWQGVKGKRVTAPVFRHLVDFSGQPARSQRRESVNLTAYACRVILGPGYRNMVLVEADETNIGKGGDGLGPQRPRLEALPATSTSQVALQMKTCSLERSRIIILARITMRRTGHYGFQL